MPCRVAHGSGIIQLLKVLPLPPAAAVCLAMHTEVEGAGGSLVLEGNVMRTLTHLGRPQHKPSPSHQTLETVNLSLPPCLTSTIITMN